MRAVVVPVRVPRVRGRAIGLEVFELGERERVDRAGDRGLGQRRDGHDSRKKPQGEGLPHVSSLPDVAGSIAARPRPARYIQVRDGCPDSGPQRVPRRLPRPARRPAAGLDDAAGRPLPAGVSRGAPGCLVHGALPLRGPRHRGLAPALPPVRTGRRHLLLGHPGPGRRDGRPRRVRRRRAGSARARARRGGDRKARAVRSRRGDRLHRRDPVEDSPRGRGPGGRPRFLRRAVDAGFLSGRRRRLEELRGAQDDDGTRARDAPPPPRPPGRRRGGRPVLPARLGRGRGAALRHVGGRARARRLPGVGAPGRRARHRRHPPRRSPGHPVRQRLRAPDRGDGRVRRRRPLDRLAPAPVRGPPPGARQTAAGQPRSGPPARGAGRGRPAHAARCSRRRGGEAHVVNLGHGVLPGARLECVEAFFAEARRGAAVAVPA